MKRDLRSELEEHGIRASAHRLAVAEYVLNTADHPSADRVWKQVSESFPAISRATVYNTLNLFVEQGLLQELHVDRDHVVFDPIVESHHHFIDEETGAIHDIPFDRVKVQNLESLRDFRIRDYQVILRGTHKSTRRH